MLVITQGITLVFGIEMILTVLYIGNSYLFDTFYCAASIVDFTKDLVAGIIIFKYLELESKGMVLSL